MRFQEPPLSKKTFTLVALPLAFELTFALVLIFLSQQYEAQLESERHARDVTSHLNQILRLLMAEGTLAVSTRISSNPLEQSGKRRVLDDRIKVETSAVKDLVAGHPAEEEAFNEIHGLLTDCLKILAQNKQATLEGDRFGMIKAWGSLNKLTLKLQQRMDELIIQMNNLQEETQTQQTMTRHAFAAALFLGLLVNVLIAVALGILFHRGTIRRLNTLMDNTQRLAAGKELSPAIEGIDEIARLDHTFRQMAALLEEANRKQRATFENAVDVICSIDKDGRFASVNPASVTVWGLSPEDLQGTRISQIIFKDDVNDTLEKIKQIIADQSFGSFENRVIKSDRSLVDMNWTAQWSSEEKTLFCVAHDITERKQIDRLKADFVAMVSHDLRTPLNSVQGFLELLGAEAYGNLSEDGYDSLEITEASVKRLIALINDLLDLEKMESGMLELRIAKTDMKSVLSSSIGSVISFAKQADVEVTINGDAHLILEADNDRLVQVVVNLLSNAIKFSPKGERVTIDVAKMPDAVRVNIRDRGRGVPEKMRESIFERFKQVELNDERKKGGSGLGLAICKAIIERHGGKIGVEPGENEVGSVFWFTLPLTASIAPAEKARV
ncbi:MAG: PAS domain S-box protein [Cyanobacteria bacterium SZAS LIN-5]|nr:PAS domain S-box protein [Cyanobacteria bacterium SZAS LIN-5]RTL45165.1 MAG: PAS domain S-box protein [Candidatus Melainabacteria bacterium]